MSLVVNRLTVKPNMDENLAERFAQPHDLEDSPGFAFFTLLKQPGVMKVLHLVILAIGVVLTSGCDQSPTANQQAQRSATAITFTDDAGREIALVKPADRIVAGASFAVELLMALDHPPVLRPDVPEEKIHPEAARSIPTFPVQHGTGPDAEAIATANADLVILHVRFAAFAENIRKTLGVQVALFEIRSLEDVSAKLELLGRITSQKQQATQQVESLRQGMSEVLADHPHTHPRVLALFGTPEAFYAYRGSSYLGSMIEALDGVNLAADQEPLGGMRSIAPLNLEQAIGRNAEVILVIPHGPPKAVIAHLSAHPTWSQMPAVKSGRVHVLDEVLFSSNPGPRSPQALSQLKTLLYPESP